MTESNMSWHSESVADVRASVESSNEGLSRSEAAERHRRFGANEIEPEPPTSPLALLAHQFKSPLIYILLVAGVVTLVIGEYVDAGVIGAVLFLNAVIGFTQERRAETAVRELSELVSPRAKVIRDGHEHEVDSRVLVPGDVVLLESGARVPADVRLSSTTTLSIDESLLTGESVPVDKQTAPVAEASPVADRSNMAHTGTVVSRGRGRGYVVAIGEDTELGSIAERLRGEEAAETPLQKRMNRFATIVSIVAAIAAVASFGIGVLMGQGATEMFMVAVALAVSAVPEGLPVALTITLAVGVRRMAARNAIIRNLPAVETLGSTTVIGSDKTGTLTENRMTVERIWTPDDDVYLEADAISSVVEDVVDNESLRRTLFTGVLANEGEFYRSDAGGEEHIETSGDPTETALLVAAARLGVEPEQTRDEFESVAEIPFESERQFSASVRAEGDRQVVYVKGAPERILSMSTAMFDDGETVGLDRDRVLGKAAEMAARGLRVLAMAYRMGAPGSALDVGTEPDELCFLGLVGMMDPPRPEVREAIAGCQHAGMRVLMITGDHAATARSIAHDLGLVDSKDVPVLTGAELIEMDDDELTDAICRISVYARVAPEQKLRVVRALQSLGEVVAVTGDGVNDAPALKAAEIGISMGKSGTDVARAASDMVLADDNFVSIHAAVEEGRITFDNIRKVTFFLISTGAAEILTILTALSMGWAIPYVAAQILWLNLVTNGLQDVALAFEPGEKGVLDRPPRKKNEGVLSRLLWTRTLIAGLVMGAGTLVMFHWELSQGGSLERARTVALTTMVFFQMFHVGNARSDHQSIFTRSPFSNRFLFLATAAAFLIHVGALYFPATQFVLRVEPIADWGTWVRMALVASSILVAVELHKLYERWRNPRGGATRG
ncbi:MAG: cation-translocating P-type ATPase [Persicimonas sp.]